MREALDVPVPPIVESGARQGVVLKHGGDDGRSQEFALTIVVVGPSSALDLVDFSVLARGKCLLPRYGRWCQVASSAGGGALGVLSAEIGLPPVDLGREDQLVGAFVRARGGRSLIDQRLRGDSLACGEPIGVVHLRDWRCLRSAVVLRVGRCLHLVLLHLGVQLGAPVLQVVVECLLLVVGVLELGRWWRRRVRDLDAGFLLLLLAGALLFALGLRCDGLRADRYKLLKVVQYRRAGIVGVVVVRVIR